MSYAQDLHDKIAAIGVRIFKIVLGRESSFWIHPNKTTPEWRTDLKAFLENNKFIDPPVVDVEDGELIGGYAEDKLYNALFHYMESLGYEELDDVISDIFEGRVAHEVVKIVDNPEHCDVQVDGFGHYGWESKST